jgi:Ca2+-binding RTX toxin-like protein
MSNVSISAQEQLLLELINRARLDPSGEAARFGISLNEGLASGTISGAAKAPLAFDFDLSESSANHSSWMLAVDVFSHTGVNGSTSNERMRVAGYDFDGYWGSAENISWRGTTGALNLTATIYEHYKGLFLSEGHRVNTLGNYREIGIAQESGSFTKGGVTYNASMLTENFARSGTDAFITGVVYADRDGDRFYDVGEGRSGIVVDWLGNAKGGVASAAAGGYAVGIPTGLDGWAKVAVDVGSITLQASLDMTGTSVKLDVINGRILASSTDMVLGSNAKGGLLLGAANTDLVGNGGGNGLVGNKGANTLNGMGGNDTLKGGAGADRLVGGTGADLLKGGAGADDFVFGAGHSTPGGRDTIADFARRSDDIVLSGLDAHLGRSGDQDFSLDGGGSFAAGEIRQKVTSSGLLLEINTDGDSTAEMAILVRGLSSALAASDFML